MAKKINFSVHRNPQPDSEGNATFQVRNENYRTMTTNELLSHLEYNGLARRELMEMALAVLQKEIVEQVTDNKRLHLNGIGTFFLKLGFRHRKDENGKEIKPHFTDPDSITGNDVAIETISFTPDSGLLGLMQRYSYSFENVNKKGTVGKSAVIDLEQIKSTLQDYFKENNQITASQFRALFKQTKYKSEKFLEELVSGPSPYLKRERVGKMFIYRLA